MDTLFSGLFQAFAGMFSWRVWLCMALALAGVVLIDHEIGSRVLKGAALLAFGLPLCLMAVRWELAHERRRERERP